MLAHLDAEDWSWQPAREGRIRSGTASVKPAGRAKLRAGAIWVAPDYRDQNTKLLEKARLDSFDRSATEAAVLGALGASAGMTLTEITEAIGPGMHLSPSRISGRVSSALVRLRKLGAVSVTRGVYRLS
jgi:hypothetical protein